MLKTILLLLPAFLLAFDVAVDQFFEYSVSENISDLRYNQYEKWLLTIPEEFMNTSSLIGLYDQPYTKYTV